MPGSRRNLATTSISLVTLCRRQFTELIATLPCSSLGNGSPSLFGVDLPVCTRPSMATVVVRLSKGFDERCCLQPGGFNNKRPIIAAQERSTQQTSSSANRSLLDLDGGEPGPGVSKGLTSAALMGNVASKVKREAFLLRCVLGCKTLGTTVWQIAGF